MSEVVNGSFGATQPVRHIFGEPVSVAPSLALDRHQQTERTCSVCGAVKVTVHAPDGSAWREWRTSSSAAQLRLRDDLPCLPHISGAKAMTLRTIASSHARPMSSRLHARDTPAHARCSTFPQAAVCAGI